MGLYFVAGLSVSILLLGAVASLLLFVLRIVVRTFHAALPPVFRHGFANLYRPGNQARSVLVALGIGVMFTLATYLLQNTVLREVSGEGPGRQGNLFLLDIRDSTHFSTLLEGQPGVTGKLALVGYVVSRLVEKNGVPADKMPLTTQRKDQLQTAQAEHRTISTGRHKSAAGPLVGFGRLNCKDFPFSEEVMRDFKLYLGDSLKFQVAGRPLNAKVVAVFRRDGREHRFGMTWLYPSPR